MVTHGADFYPRIASCTEPLCAGALLSIKQGPAKAKTNSATPSLRHDFLIHEAESVHFRKRLGLIAPSFAAHGP